MGGWMDGCVGYVSVFFRVVYLQCPAVFSSTSPHRPASGLAEAEAEARVSLGGRRDVRV